MTNAIQKALVHLALGKLMFGGVGRYRRQIPTDYERENGRSRRKCSIYSTIYCGSASALRSASDPLALYSVVDSLH